MMENRGEAESIAGISASRLRKKKKTHRFPEEGIQSSLRIFWMCAEQEREGDREKRENGRSFGTPKSSISKQTSFPHWPFLRVEVKAGGCCALRKQLEAAGAVKAESPFTMIMCMTMTNWHRCNCNRSKETPRGASLDWYQQRNALHTGFISTLEGQKNKTKQNKFLMLIQCFTGELNRQDDRNILNWTLHKITVKSAAIVIARVIKKALRHNFVWPRGGHRRLEAVWRYYEIEHSQQLPLALMNHGKTNWCRTFPACDCAPEITCRSSLQTLLCMWVGGGVVQHAIYMQNELNTHRKHARMKRANAYAITQTHSPCKRRKKGWEMGVKKHQQERIN